MRSLTFSPAAIADIDSIWDYTAAHWGLDQAERYTDEIRDASLAVACGSKWGRAVDVGDGYRMISFGSHMVYFRETEDRVTIIRIHQVRQHEDRRYMMQTGS